MDIQIQNLLNKLEELQLRLKKEGKSDDEKIVEEASKELCKIYARTSEISWGAP